MESRAGGVARARRVIDSSSAHKGGKGGDGVKVRERVGGLGQLQWGFFIKKKLETNQCSCTSGARNFLLRGNESVTNNVTVLQIMLQCYSVTA